MRAKKELRKVYERVDKVMHQVNEAEQICH